GPGDGVQEAGTGGDDLGALPALRGGRAVRLPVRAHQGVVAAAFSAGPREAALGSGADRLAPLLARRAHERARGVGLPGPRGGEQQGPARALAAEGSVAAPQRERPPLRKADRAALLRRR